MKTGTAQFFAFPSDAVCIRKPGKQRAWMHAVFGPSQDGESENCKKNAVGLSDLSGKVFSFGYFSLHQQRKVTRAQARKLLAGFGQKSKTPGPRVSEDDGVFGSGDSIAHHETIESSRLTPLLRGAMYVRAAA